MPTHLIREEWENSQLAKKRRHIFLRGIDWEIN
jgi:hypothetical protein